MRWHALFSGEAIALSSPSPIIVCRCGLCGGGTDLPDKLAGSTIHETLAADWRSAHDEIDLTDVTICVSAPPLLSSPLDRICLAHFKAL